MRNFVNFTFKFGPLPSGYDDFTGSSKYDDFTEAMFLSFSSLSQI